MINVGSDFEKIIDEVLRIAEERIQYIGILEFVSPTTKTVNTVNVAVKLNNIFEVSKDPLIQAVSKVFTKRFVEPNNLRSILEKIDENLPDNVVEETVRKTYKAYGDKNDFISRVLLVRTLIRELEKSTSRSFRKKVRKSIPLYGNINIKYVRKIIESLSKLDCKSLAILTEMLLALDRNKYKSFYNIEWLLVLISRWSKLNGGLIPAYPSCTDTLLVYYYYLYRCCNENTVTCYEMIDIRDFIKFILKLLKFI